MPRFVDPSNGNVSFISDAALANPAARGIDLDNMSAVWVDSAGQRWVSNGSALVLLGAVSGGGILAKPQALRPFRAALAGRNIAPCDILFIGDSIQWGLKALMRSARIGEVGAATLRARFPQNAAGGQGFMSARQAFGSDTFSDASIVLAGGASGVGANFGLDQNAVLMSAIGHKATYTFTGTGFDIFYAQYGGGGTFSYKVDAGSTTNIVTNGATNYGARNQAIRGLSVGVHTVECAWVSGTVYQTGAMAYNGDESTGVRQWIAAWPSTASTYWWNVANNYWFDSIGNVQPSLVCIELGPNDYAGASPVAVATFKANVKSIIAEIKTRCTIKPSFVLCPTWPLTPVAPLAPWSAYVTAMTEIASEDADALVCVHDWQAITSSTAGTTIGGILTLDNTHPGVMGNRYLGEAQAAFVSP